MADGIEPRDGRPAATIAKAVGRACALWGLGDAEASRLFGVPEALWPRMKAGAFHGRLEKDQVLRASLILGIFTALRRTFNGDLVYGWPTAPNADPLFKGRSPVAVMIEGGIPAMLQTRRYLDGLGTLPDQEASP